MSDDQTAEKAQHDELAVVAGALLEGGCPDDDHLGSLLLVLNYQLEVALLASSAEMPGGSQTLTGHIDRLCHLSKAAVDLHMARKRLPKPQGD